MGERWTYRHGDYIRHSSATGDWWEFVVGEDPRERLVTVDPNGVLARHSDPSDTWVKRGEDPTSESERLRWIVCWLDGRAAADNRYVRSEAVERIRSGFSSEELERIVFSGEGPDDWS